MKLSDGFPKSNKKGLEALAFFLGTIHKCCDPKGRSAIGYHTNLKTEIRVFESYEKAGIVKIYERFPNHQLGEVVKVLLTKDGEELLEDLKKQGYLSKVKQEEINERYGSKVIYQQIPPSFLNNSEITDQQKNSFLHEN